MTSMPEILRSRLQGVRQCGSGWKALCPGHEDKKASLSVGVGRDGRTLLKCFAGCAREAIVSALGLTMQDLFPPAPRNRHKPQPKKRIALADLAREKLLPIEFLRSCGLHDMRGGGVAIPYRDAEGKVVETKRRTALRAKDGSWWPRGKPLLPYGLDKLDGAKAKGALLLVEGETDTLTAWYHGRACLGIPGAGSARSLQAKHLEGMMRLYVVEEPDPGGRNFTVGLALRLEELGWEGKAFVVTLDGAKDISDLHIKVGGDRKKFRAALKEAVRKAMPLAKEEGAPAANIPTHEPVNPPRSEQEPEQQAIDEDADDAPVDAATIAHSIVETGERFARDGGGKLHIFERGAYVPKGERHIRALVKRYFLTVGQAQKWNSHKAAEVVNYIEADAPELWEIPPLDRVNVLNGILDLKKFLESGDTKDILLLPHAPDHLSPIQLPVRYDPEARCPNWEAQVNATFPDDARDLAWEICGWLMVPWTSLQRAVLLLGEGGTGKSTFLAAVRAFGTRIEKSINFRMEVGITSPFICVLQRPLDRGASPSSSPSSL